MGLGAGMTTDSTTQPENKLPSATKALEAGLPWFVQVGSGSMHPALPVGAVLELEPCHADSLKRGQIACLRSEHGLLIHRFVGHEEFDGSPFVRTRGDSLSSDDPPQPAALVVGRVRGVEWAGARIRIDQLPGAWYSRLLGQTWPLIRRAHALRQRCMRLVTP